MRTVQLRTVRIINLCDRTATDNRWTDRDALNCSGEPLPSPAPRFLLTDTGQLV
jgi:hypothetical protein